VYGSFVHFFFKGAGDGVVHFAGLEGATVLLPLLDPRSGEATAAHAVGQEVLWFLASTGREQEGGGPRSPDLQLLSVESC